MMPGRYYDSGDLDAILELERSPGYALEVERIRAVIEQKRFGLEFERQGQEAVVRLQGELAGLRLALSIPEILKDEIKRQLAA